jgi:hypothetical protein
MRYFYYPLSTRDFSFENIFASESISPHAFYNLRGFGIDYFYKIPLMHHEQALILYNSPPKYELPSDSGDAAKFILAVAEETLDQNDILLIKEGIIGYQKTIYLNKDNFKVFFFSEKERKIAFLKSETSLPTKGLKKYANNFFLITEAECQSFDTTNIANLDFGLGSTGNHILFDRSFNHFKGFIYGISIGLLTSKTNEEIHIRRVFREIMNCFAELKNRSEHSSRNPENKYSKSLSYSQQAPLDVYERKLRASIEQAEDLFSRLFPGEGFSEEKLVKFMQEKYSSRLKSAESAQLYINHAILDQQLFGDAKFSKLKDLYLRNRANETPLLHFDILKDQAENFLKNTKQNSSWSGSNREAANEKFKESLFELGKFIEAKFLQGTSDKNVELGVIHFNIEKSEVVFDKGFQSLNNGLIEEYSSILNSIFKNIKSGRGDTKKENILSIVTQIGSVFSKSKSPKSSQLYQYLNNEISTYSIDKVSSIVLRNFVAFIFNPDSIEKLESYLEAKEIDEKWIAYSFWCAYNGFANTSGNFVKPIFETGNVAIQKSLDSYLQNILLMPAVNAVAAVESGSDRLVKSRDFFEKYIAGKHPVSFDDFLRGIHTDNMDQILKELKEKGNISKKEGRKIIEAYKEYINAAMLF